ncbi:hypothetical protein EYF80_062592 [Liparis tanakae]|uniref:Uncharacterized protein n=1 Tax=Liparis tanakae TaxID=230148 RepID=A0A4Z2EEG6_9TELE|nr:hypothetical protein EYF80_062592 [Liparis tanakae]
MLRRPALITATRRSLARPRKSGSLLLFITSSSSVRKSETCFTWSPVGGERVAGDDGGVSEAGGEEELGGGAGGDHQQGQQPPARPLQQLGVRLSQPGVGAVQQRQQRQNHVLRVQHVQQNLEQNQLTPSTCSQYSVYSVYLVFPAAQGQTQEAVVETPLLAAARHVSGEHGVQSGAAARLQQPDQREEAPVEGRRGVRGQVGLTQHTHSETRSTLAPPPHRGEEEEDDNEDEEEEEDNEEEDDEECLPSHGPVQASGQRDRLQHRLQHGELVLLTWDRRGQVSLQHASVTPPSRLRHASDTPPTRLRHASDTPRSSGATSWAAATARSPEASAGTAPRDTAALRAREDNLREEATPTQRAPGGSPVLPGPGGALLLVLQQHHEAAQTLLDQNRVPEQRAGHVGGEGVH